MYVHVSGCVTLCVCECVRMSAHVQRQTQRRAGLGLGVQVHVQGEARPQLSLTVRLIPSTVSLAQHLKTIGATTQFEP